MRLSGLFATVAALVAFAAPPAGAQVTVTHVANEGFLLAASDGKVLIDALFDEGIEGYGQIPDSLRPALEGGAEPFDGVTLALATHRHADHFGAASVVRFLEANAAALFVSTPQAVAEVAARAGAGSPIAGRVRALFPPPGVAERVSHRGLEVEVLNLHHGDEGRTQNLGFLVRLGGTTVLHVGDAEVGAEELVPHRLDKTGIDLALLPFWWLLDSGRVVAVRDRIAARALGAMHLPTRSAPASWFGEPGSSDAAMRAIAAAYPGTRLFAEPLAEATYRPAGGDP
jgi:L-ascorbate metabolism protein UlaG (beta-lactamase superfamily)